MVLSILGHAHSSVGDVISEKNYADKASISGSDAEKAFTIGAEMENLHDTMKKDNVESVIASSSLLSIKNQSMTMTNLDGHDFRRNLVSSTQNIISTFAGGNCGVSLNYQYNGPATCFSSMIPRAIALDGSGNLFIADSNFCSILLVTPAGIITTYAGTNQCGNFNGDGGAATSAGLSSSYGIVVDSSGNIYFSDTNNRIRFVARTTKIISTYAGNGQ